jgi:long-chain acyl-CoA synthetase
VDRIWLKHYPPGVPAEINPAEFPSLLHLVEHCIDRHRDQPCFTCMGRTLTYGDLDGLATRFAAYLQRVARLRRGDRIALMMPNVLQYPVASAAALRAGYAVVNVNPLYTPRELKHQLTDSGAEAIVILENFATRWPRRSGKTASSTSSSPAWATCSASRRALIVNFVVRRVKKLVPAFSLPKAVQLQRRAAKGRHAERSTSRRLDPMTSPSCNIPAARPAFRRARRCFIATCRQRAAERRLAAAGARTSRRMSSPLVVCALPLYHIFALTACFLMGM